MDSNCKPHGPQQQQQQQQQHAPFFFFASVPPSVPIWLGFVNERNCRRGCFERRRAFIGHYSVHAEGWGSRLPCHNSAGQLGIRQEFRRPWTSGGISCRCHAPSRCDNRIECILENVLGRVVCVTAYSASARSNVVRIAVRRSKIPLSNQESARGHWWIASRPLLSISDLSMR